LECCAGSEGLRWVFLQVETHENGVVSQLENFVEEIVAELKL
jgi:hypothetical protein